MNDGTDWLRELNHAWPLLLGPEQTGGIAAMALPLHFAGVSVRVGVDSARSRHLLVPVGAEEVRSPDLQGALVVQLRTYTFQGVPRRYVDVACTQSDLSDVFDEVLADVLSKISNAAYPASACLQAVDRWRALLAAKRPRYLSLVQQMSLYAELSIFQLLTGQGALRASWWRGPLREPHDFRTDRLAVEVKAVGNTSRTVTIHGIEQLDPSGKPLALAIVEVVEDTAGTTLSELVESLVANVDDRTEFGYLLLSAGYNRGDAAQYLQPYSMREVRHAIVSDSFPRIVTQSFKDGVAPAGVSSLNYQVSLDAISALLVPGELAFRAWASSHV